MEAKSLSVSGLGVLLWGRLYYRERSISLTGNELGVFLWGVSFYREMRKVLMVKGIGERVAAMPW